MNAIPRFRPNPVDALLTESEQLEQRMSTFQDEPEPSQTQVSQVRSDYRSWHARARRLLVGDALRNFDQERDGSSIFSPGVAKFLDNPRQESVIKADGSFPVGRWQFPFEQVRGRLEKQRRILLETQPQESDAELVATDLAMTLRRLPQFLDVLQRRKPDWSVIGAIADEYDLQVLVEAILRLLFDDVRPEDYFPSRAGANSRVDFLMPEVGVVVETKMTRPNLTARKVGEELIVDRDRYRQHPECSAIVALIYDPARIIENPRGLERDLTQHDPDVAFYCVVVQ